MPALDLGPGNWIPTQAASRPDRARVRELVQVRLDRVYEQVCFGLVGAPRRVSQRGVNLGRKFQVHLSADSLGHGLLMVALSYMSLTDTKLPLPQIW